VICKYISKAFNPTLHLPKRNSTDSKRKPYFPVRVICNYPRTLVSNPSPSKRKLSLHPLIQRWSQSFWLLLQGYIYIYIYFFDRDSKHRFFAWLMLFSSSIHHTPSILHEWNTPIYKDSKPWNGSNGETKKTPNTHSILHPDFFEREAAKFCMEAYSQDLSLSENHI
jgi:hypothetical protein